MSRSLSIQVCSGFPFTDCTSTETSACNVVQWRRGARCVGATGLFSLSGFWSFWKRVAGARFILCGRVFTGCCRVSLLAYAGQTVTDKRRSAPSAAKTQVFLCPCEGVQMTKRLPVQCSVCLCRPQVVEHGEESARLLLSFRKGALWVGRRDSAAGNSASCRQLALSFFSATCHWIKTWWGWGEGLRCSLVLG